MVKKKAQNVNSYCLIQNTEGKHAYTHDIILLQCDGGFQQQIDTSNAAPNKRKH